MPAVIPANVQTEPSAMNAIHFDSDFWKLPLKLLCIRPIAYALPIQDTGLCEDE